MATLLDRLTGININRDIPGEERIPMDTFLGGMVDVAYGDLTKANVVSYYNLDAGQESDLDWLIGQYQLATDKQFFIWRVGHKLSLANDRVPGYTNTAALKTQIEAING